MALTDITYIERLLITFYDDQTVKGAHMSTLRTVRNPDGTRFCPDDQHDAVPVSPEALSKVMPDRAALLAQLQETIDNLTATTESRDALAKERDALSKQVEKSTADLLAMTKAREDVANDRDALKANVAALQKALDDARNAAAAPAVDPHSECERRIYAVASPNCQMNMTAAMAAGILSADERAAFVHALAWVAAMRARCLECGADPTINFHADAVWPVCPADVAALAARY